jgi:LysM repeat protein
VAVGLLLWFGDPSAVGRVLGEDPLEQPIEAADTSSTTFDAPDRQRTDATDPAEREAVWRRPSCYQLDVDRARLNLTVYGGMTLSELAQHFRTTMSELRRVNPSLRSGQLVAGRSYVIPVDHLQAARHVVAPGETLSRLSALYDAPSPYSIRTWNCLGSNTIRRGDRLLVFADPSQTDGTPIEERERQALAPDLARAGCFEYWEDRDELRLKVFRGMTISDLSVHMRLSPAEVRRACGAEGNKLIAGRECLFDVSHLRLQRTPVERGDNLWSLRRQYDCPSRFSIRAWNCLPNNQLRVGDRLALWLPGTRADSR